MAKKNTEVSALENTSLAVPDYLSGKGRSRGKENITEKDIQMPRVKLLQAGADEVKMKIQPAGLIVDSVTTELLGKAGKELDFIPILHYKSLTLFDEGIGKDAKVECRSANAVKSESGKDCLSCPKNQWGEDKKGNGVPPECTLFYNFPILITNMNPPRIASLSMSSTKIKAAKKILTAASRAGNVDMFGLKFRLTVVEETGKGLPFFNYSVAGLGYATKAEYEACEKLYEGMKDKQLAAPEETDAPAPQEPAKPVNPKKKF